MMIYCAARFKPKKKRKVKGEVAKKYRHSSAILGVEKLPTLSYGHRIGASDARAIASLNSDRSYTEKRESLMYTGTLVKGIATMHKSNAVPVIDEEQMKDISRMRRG
jgi:hypothetical protein